MPKLNQYTYPGYLDNFINRGEFYALDEQDAYKEIESFRRSFIEQSGQIDKEGESEINEYTKKSLENFREISGGVRYRPSQEDAIHLYNPIPEFKENEDTDKVEEGIDKWIDESLKKASSEMPSNKEDFEVHLNDIANKYIRDFVGKKEYKNSGILGAVDDKLSRSLEAFVRPFHSLADYEGAERFYSKHLVENPETDESIFSDFASGLGQLTSQAIIASALTASGNPELVPAAFGLLYGSLYMKEGYKEEMKRTGNEELATERAISQIPAAALDTFSDAFLFRGLFKGSDSFAKRYLKTSSESEKRAILKEAIPSIRKEAGIQLISEGVIGGAGADSASNLGHYYVTGDEQYLKNATDIAKLTRSAIVEGTLGLLSGSGSAFLQKGGAQEQTSQILEKLTLGDAKSKEILTALKQKDYEKVINLTKNTIAPDELDLMKDIYDKYSSEAGKTATPTEEKQPGINVTKDVRDRIKVQSQGDLYYGINILKRINYLKSQKDKDNSVEISRLNNALTELKTKGVEEKNEFEATGGVNDFIYSGKGEEREEKKLFSDVLLEDDSKLESDEDVVFIENKNGELVKQLNLLNVLRGKSPSLVVSSSGTEARIGSKDSPIIKKVSQNPKEGYSPVVIKYNEEGDIVKSKIKILPRVKSFNKVSLSKSNIEILRKNDDGSVIAKIDGVEKRLTGNIASSVLYNDTKKRTQEQRNLFNKKDESINQIFQTFDNIDKPVLEKDREKTIDEINIAYRNAEKYSDILREAGDSGYELFEDIASILLFKLDELRSKRTFVSLLDEGEQQYELPLQQVTQDSVNKAADKLNVQRPIVSIEGVAKNSAIKNFEGSNLFFYGDSVTIGITDSGIVGTKQDGSIIEITPNINIPASQIEGLSFNESDNIAEEVKAQTTALKSFTNRAKLKRQKQEIDEQLAIYNDKNFSGRERNNALELVRDQIRLLQTKGVNYKTQFLPKPIVEEQSLVIDAPIIEQEQSEQKTVEEQKITESVVDEKLDQTKKQETTDIIAPITDEKNTLIIPKEQKPIDKKPWIKNAINNARNKQLTYDYFDREVNGTRVFDDATLDEISKQTGVKRTNKDGSIKSNPEFVDELNKEMSKKSPAQRLERANELKKERKKTPRDRTEQQNDRVFEDEENNELDEEVVDDRLESIDEHIRRVRRSAYDSVKDIVRDISKMLNYDKIFLIKDINELNENLRPYIDEFTNAIIDFETGNVYIFVYNLKIDNGKTLEGEIERLAIHEIAGHIGMHKVLRGISENSFSNLFEFLKKMDNGEIYNFIKDHYKQRSDQTDADYKSEIFDEMLAFLVESSDVKYKSLLEIIIDKIRIFLAKIGFKRWSNNDVKALVQASFRQRYDKIANNKNIRFSISDLIALTDLSKTGKDFANQLQNIRRPDGSRYIERETKTEEDLNILAAEIIQTAKSNPEIFTIEVAPEKLSYDYLFRDNNGPIDMNDPVDKLRATDEARYVYDLKKSPDRFLEFTKKEAELLTKERESILRNTADYFYEQFTFEVKNGHKNKIKTLSGDLYTPYEAAQILLAMGKMSINSLPNGQYQSVEITKSNRQMPLAIDGEYASAIKDELRLGKNIKESFKGGFIKIQELKKTSNKNIKDGWIKFEKSNDISKASEIQKLCAGSGWCVGSSANTAASYLSSGDFYLYFENGKPEIAIGYNSEDRLERPRGRLPGQALKEEHEAIAEKKIRDDKIIGGEDFLYDRDLKKEIYDILKNDKPISKEFIRNNFILNETQIIANVKYKTFTYTEDFKSSEEIDKQLLKKAKEQGVNFFKSKDNETTEVFCAFITNKLNTKLVKCHGDFEASNLQSAPLLTEVGGHFYAPNLQSAPLLTEVDGYFDVQNLQSAPLLKYVGGSLYAANLQTAPLLTEVGGNLIAPNLQSAPLLTEVGGNLIAQNLQSAPLLKEFSATNLQTTTPPTNNASVRQSRQVNSFSFSGDSSDDFWNMFLNPSHFNRAPTTRRVVSLLAKKLNQNLIIEENDVYSGFKSLSKQLRFMEPGIANNLEQDIENFVNTRTSVENPETFRTSIDELKQKIAIYKEQADKAEYNYYKALAPSIPDFSEFSDIGGVRALFNELQLIDESQINKSLFNDSDINYVEAIGELQYLLLNDIDNPDSVINNLFIEARSKLNPTGNTFLDAGIPIITERIDKLQQVFSEYIMYLISQNPSELTKNELRHVYFSLMSIAHDGYPSGLDTFMSDSFRNILNSEESYNFLNPYRSETGMLKDKVETFALKIRRLAGDSKAMSVLNKITSPLRDGVFQSERYHSSVITPYLEDALDRAMKLDKKLYTDKDYITMGIYGILRQHFISEQSNEGLRKNIEWLKKSIQNSRTFDKKTGKAADFREEILNKFINGINLDDKGAMNKLEENASNILTDGQIQYVSDTVKMFDSLKPLSKLTTEFVYNRTFDEIYNYIPTMSIVSKGRTQKENIDIQQFQLETDHISISNGNIGYRNINTSGMGTTKDRMRTVGTNRSLVLNIVHSGDSIGRLASLDYFTSIERREISKILNPNGQYGKQFASILGDKENSLGRIETFKRAIKTLWENELTKSSFLHPMQVFANWAARKYSQVKLSGLHQFPDQFVTNQIPFFVQNITNTRKIKNYIKALSYFMKYKTGNLEQQQNSIMNKLLFELERRHQFAELDHSIMKNSDGYGFITLIKEKLPLLYKAVSGIDKLGESFLMAPFKYSDMFSGSPILMAEYLTAEEQRLGRELEFDDMLWNYESYMSSIDEVERFIGVGSSSRRGEWLTNRDSMVSILRNVLVAFRSHAINNATNFTAELKKVVDSNVGIEQKAKSLRYMAGIALQSTAFVAIKMAIYRMIATGIKLLLKDKDEEDELKDLYLKSQGKMSKEERATVEAEIAMRKNIRTIFNRLSDRNESDRVAMYSIFRDNISNMFVVPATLDFLPDAIIFMGDKFHEQEFRKDKDNRISVLKSNLDKQKKLENYKTAAEIEEELDAVKSMDFIPVVYESRGFINLGGIYGGAARGYEDTLTSFAGGFIDGKDMSLEDMFIYMSLVGLSQPDLLKASKTYDKILFERQKRNEKIEAIKNK